MPYHYAFTRVGVLHSGYNFRLIIPFQHLKEAIFEYPSRIKYNFRVFLEGEKIKTIEGVISFDSDGNTTDSEPRFELEDFVRSPDTPGYYELSFASDDDRPVFSTSAVYTSYGLYWMPGKKSFVAEIPFKYADPRVVMQIKRIGETLQSYGAVVLDRDLDYGESVCVINAYNKAGVTNVYASGKGLIKRVRVQPNSAVNIQLNKILLENCDRWVGSIQMGGETRFPLFTKKHKISNASWISDHEHLDFFKTASTMRPRANYFMDKTARMLIRMGLKERPLIRE